ncbi:MAG: hypothetical protein AAGI63_16245, partial [Planctomycetota bacterium]
AFADETDSGTYRSTAVDLSRRPVPRLAHGIVLGKEKEAGYSNLVTLVEPRLASGDIDSLPHFAQRYASMFQFTVLANVTALNQGGQTFYLLDRVGVGFAMNIKGEKIVVTQDTANRYGADLGRIDRAVLGGNEDCLDDIVQVARTNQMIVFDAEANMVVGSEHDKRFVRHFIWVSPSSGKLGFLVWLLDDQGGASYQVASQDMKWLPSGYREDRRIHVSDGGLLSSIPTPDRFALESLPRGKSVPMSAQLKQVAGKKQLTASDLKTLVAAVSDSLSRVRITQRSNP